MILSIEMCIRSIAFTLPIGDIDINNFMNEKYDTMSTLLLLNKDYNVYLIFFFLQMWLQRFCIYAVYTVVLSLWWVFILLRYIFARYLIEVAARHSAISLTVYGNVTLFSLRHII